MPLRLPAVELAADAASLRRARALVRGTLESLDRRDLLDSALVGTSELVTNAVLHGTAPYSIQVRGTRRRPRVEVRDGSRQPPVLAFDVADQDRLMATYGRGLGLVAMFSAAWGADLTPTGKVVWFVPAVEPRTEGDLSGAVYDHEAVLQEDLPSAARPPPLVRIRIRGLPLAAFAGFRQRYFDLARELRLLSLSGEHPAARRFSAVFLRAERLSLQVRGLDQVHAALSRHEDAIDVELLVPAGLPEVMQQLLDALEQVDELCRHEEMLTLAPTGAEECLIRWWFTEFVRQGAGDPPTPWPDFLESADL